MSLVCPWIATHHTCQFWVRSEPVNMPRTIESPAKCGVSVVIPFLYSEQGTRSPQVLFFFMTMLGHILQLQQKIFWSVFGGKCLITHHHAPGLGSLWFSSLSSYETVVGGQHLAQWAADQRRELLKAQTGCLLWRGYWKVGTTLRKMSTSERLLCREVAGGCG